MRDWSMCMQWHDLLFIHWPVRPDVLRPLLPRGLKLDLYDGEGWIGVVPFRMTHVRHRVLPPLPGLSAFEELNVRTYVTCKGRPGVWFFSLDAANKIAVRTARWIFNLPYFDARMSCRREGRGIRYRSTRTHTGAAPALFAADYRPTGPVFRSSKGSIDSFLTDRLCLYNTDVLDNLRRVDISHRRWPLQPAEAQIRKNTMLEQIGMKVPETEPLLHFARKLDVQAGMPQVV